jgi:hypothetical protein
VVAENDPNNWLLQIAAAKLEPILDEIAFLGGCATKYFPHLGQDAGSRAREAATSTAVHGARSKGRCLWEVIVAAGSQGKGGCFETGASCPPRVRFLQDRVP